MMTELSREDEVRALQNYSPLPRRRIELGGDIYYKCYWLSCDENVGKYDNYCKHCGQRFESVDGY